MAPERRDHAPSTLGRILRAILWSLLIAFAIGFVIGTLLRRELEKPVRYIGSVDRVERFIELGGPTRPISLAVRPGNVGDVVSSVLVACEHEEQV